MKFAPFLIVCFYISCSIGCSKQETELQKPNETDTIAVVDTPVVSNPEDTIKKLNFFENIVFSSLKYDDANQYFSTRDTSFHHPMPKGSLTATQMANVDVLYIYDNDYSAHGFMSPYTAGQEWYWNNEYYYYPWLSSSHETIFLNASNLNSENISSLSEDPSLFDELYENLYPVASNGIFPAGTCIGGRNVATFKKGQVFGLLFDNGKRGFLLIRPDQENGWPNFAITGFRTKVDLIVER
jgi:hypothetical protein